MTTATAVPARLRPPRPGGAVAGARPRRPSSACACALGFRMRAADSERRVPRGQRARNGRVRREGGGDGHLATAARNTSSERDTGIVVAPLGREAGFTEVVALLFSKSRYPHGIPPISLLFSELRWVKKNYLSYKVEPDLGTTLC